MVDNNPPAVSMTAPVTGATVTGTVTVSAAASDNVGVLGVQFLLDGVAAGAEKTAAPYTTTWNTTGATNGPHSLSAVARDAAGNATTSAAVTVLVDNSPPAVSMTAPVAGATVTGTVTVSATATDNVGVLGVQFLLDGVAAGAEKTTAPYTTTWNTTAATNGSHTLSARARDAAGNLTTSAAVTVTVSNDATPPSVSLTAPVSGATASGTLTVSANATDNVGVAGVQFLLDGAPLGPEDTAPPYSISWNTTGATNGAHTLSARARDAAGNLTTSAAVTVTVSNDTTPPTVSITAPANGATVSGKITLSATASDNVGVAGVQFLVDGVAVGAEVLKAPYSTTWKSTPGGIGTHTVSARARDAAGNQTTSTAVQVTVTH
jgi:hypothetical protein